MSLTYSPGIRLPRNPWSHGEGAWRKHGWNTDGIALSGLALGMDAPQDNRTEGNIRFIKERPGAWETL